MMHTARRGWLAIGLICCAYIPLSPVRACPCDADVDNNGITDFNDSACIMECRGGDCSCCLSSCDVNCDGVVDTGDIGDDILNDPSAWRCLFHGGSVGSCCPGAPGACCDSTTGICTNEVLEGDCTGANVTWSEGLTCAQLNCADPPAGACCNTGNGGCDDNVI